jgi:hypothetical protein
MRRQCLGINQRRNSKTVFIEPRNIPEHGHQSL